MTCPGAPLRLTRYAVPKSIDLEPIVKFKIGTMYMGPCFRSDRQASHLVVGREAGHVLLKKSTSETRDELHAQPTKRVRIFVDAFRVEYFYSNMHRVFAYAV